MKILLGIFIGILLMCFLCMCMCFGSFLILATNQDFKDSFCTQWVAEGEKRSDAPFGWCL